MASNKNIEIKLMTPQDNSHLTVIGRAEPITFIGYEKLVDIPAKVDTGAYRSAIHAGNIRVDDAGRLHFTLLDGHPTCADCATEIVTDQFTKASVSNSFGDTEERYAVTLKVKIGPEVFDESFTLANRAKKVYPILLGRKLLNNRFLVNPAISSISRDDLKIKYNDFLSDNEEDN